MKKEAFTIKKVQNEEVRSSFPSEEEIRIAQKLCCGRCCTQCECPAEYAWRKRDVDMAILMEKAIENELTKTEKETVRSHWYDFESITKIADKKKISPAAVKRTLTRAQEKLERVLRYAVCYQHNMRDESIVPLVLGRARVIAAARNAVGGNAGDRLRRLRQSQNLTKEILAPSLDITAERLERIETGELPTADELSVFSAFFEVSTDFILKGVTNEK